jgi:hypothetical protein
VLDFWGPFEDFSVANYFVDAPAFRVLTVAEKAGPVIAKDVLSVNPHVDLADCANPDMLLDPGGQAHRRTGGDHHYQAVDLLRQCAPNTEIRSNQRAVDNGRVIYKGGRKRQAALAGLKRLLALLRIGPACLRDDFDTP